MLGRLPSLTTVRLLAALLLAVIGLQASQSFDATLRPVHGSAFSAATYDVAVAPQRRADEVQAAIAPLPLLPRSAAAIAPRNRPLLAPQPGTRPSSTGPPARSILARQPAPRAPPLA